VGRLNVAPRGRPPKIPERVSSPQLLALRVEIVADAYRARDEDAMRVALRERRERADVLAKSTPLLPSLLDHRMTIACESDGRGRLA